MKKFRFYPVLKPEFLEFLFLIKVSEIQKSPILKKI